jgi:WD40 repeat protein
MESNTTTTNKLQKILKFYFGSYEGKLYALDVDLKTKKTVSSYAFKVSENSLKIVYYKDNCVFVSGVDEIVHMFDMKKKEDIGSVVTYNGTVTNLQIVKGFLFASGDENTISIWRMSDFNLIHSLKGHKSSINNFIIHKTGKFGISSSKDNTIIVWNLVTGTKIIKYNFKNNLICNKILFLKKQTLAVLIFESEVWVFDIFKNSENYEEWIIKKVKVNNKILDAFSFKSSLYLVHSNAEITVYPDITQDETFKEISLTRPEKLSENDLDIRIKMINTTRTEKLNLLNVIYTNNEIYIYDLNKINKKIPSIQDKEKFEKFMTLDLKTSDRITCLNSNLI